MLYIETSRQRYELARFVDSGATYKQMYRLAVVRDAHMKDNQFFAGLKQLPLSVEHLEQVICEDLDWRDLLWGAQTLGVKNSRVSYLIEPLRNF